MQLAVYLNIYDHAHNSCNDLPGHRRYCRSCHLQSGEPKQTKNHDRIQDNVDHCAQNLRQHRIHRFSG